MIAVLYSIHSVFKRNHDEPWSKVPTTIHSNFRLITILIQAFSVPRNPQIR